MSTHMRHGRAQFMNETNTRPTGSGQMRSKDPKRPGAHLFAPANDRPHTGWTSAPDRPETRGRR